MTDKQESSVQSNTAKKQSAFKTWTDKNAQLWQFIKFFAFSCCSGVTQGATYIILGSLLLIPLTAKALGAIDWWIFHYDAGMLYDLVAYFVSTTVGNMISFVLNRKKTFKSASNVTFSVTATLIMIAFIICYSTYFGPKLNVALGDLIPWFNTSDGTIAIRNFVGQTLLCFVTFVFVFLMDKFIILPESKEEKAAKKSRKAAADSEIQAVKTIKVVNKPLAKKFLVSSVVFLVVGIIGLAVGNAVYYSASMTKPDAFVIISLVAGSVIFGIGEILVSAFAAEKMGDEIEEK